jgi:hypothetical protein
MQANNIYKRNPHIKISTCTVNNTTDYNNSEFNGDELPIYSVILSDYALKIQFIVEWQEEQAFVITNYGRLYLDGTDRVAKNNRSYHETGEYISANAHITQALFTDILSPYGIVLDKIYVHNYTDFDTTEYHFENEKYEKYFTDYVNQALDRYFNN